VGVNLYVGAGQICGLIGPNGAGKTTLLKMVAGLLRPTSGRIEVGGIDIGCEPKQLHSMVGYVPDVFGLYDELSVKHFLEYFGSAHNVERSKLRVANFLSDLDARLADAPFVAGDQFSVADITALVTIDFAAKAFAISTPKEHRALTRWYEDVSARPSISA